jgi:hypothetical protein
MYLTDEVRASRSMPLEIEPMTSASWRLDRAEALGDAAGGEAVRRAVVVGR